MPYAGYSGSTGALQGRPLSGAAPATGQALAWDGNVWAPSSALSATRLQGRPVGTDVPTTGQVLAWDGSAWAPAADAMGLHYQRTVLLSPADTAAASGAGLLAALAGITDASADKSYLLTIEPGVYDLGTTALQMKPYVDIAGSGENVTRLLGAR